MIANCLDPSGQNGFATTARLARDTRLSIRQVKRLVSLLEASGELKVRRSSGRWANRYSLPQMIHNGDKLSPPIRKNRRDNMSPLNPDVRDSNGDNSRMNGDMNMSRDQSLERSIDHNNDLLRAGSKAASALAPLEHAKRAQSRSCRFCHEAHVDALATPAVQTYQDRFGLTPNEGFRHDIMVTINNLPLWKSVLDGWYYLKAGRRVNKNPLNIKAMLDEYERLERLR